MFKTAPGAKRYLLTCLGCTWISIVLTLGYYSFRPQPQPQRLPMPRPVQNLQTVRV